LASTGREPSNEELAEAVGMSIEETERIMKTWKHPISRFRTFSSLILVGHMIHETSQMNGSCVVLKLFECLAFDLPNAFASDLKDVADLFQLLEVHSESAVRRPE